MPHELYQNAPERRVREKVCVEGDEHSSVPMNNTRKLKTETDYHYDRKHVKTQEVCLSFIVG